MKTNLLTLLLIGVIASIPNFSFAQWEQKANPIFTKDHGIGFSLDGFGYVLTGGANGQVFSATRDFFRYDPNADSWQQLSDYPGPARGYGIGDTWNGKLYFGFGLDGNGNYLDDLWEWDPVTNAFTELPSCPCDGRVHPGFLADNGKVYMIAGGNDNGNLSDLWIYDINDSTWSQKTDIPGNRHHPYQFAINGEIYVGAGHLSSWYKYDENDNSWIQIASLVARVAGAQFSYNGKGYALSGTDVDHNSFDTGEFWEYDPAVDTWTELPAHPGASRFGPTQFVIDNYIYLLGGYYRMDGSVTPETTMYRYDLGPVSVNVASFGDDINENIFSFYPNPSSDVITLRSSEGNIGLINITSLDGKLMETYQIESKTAEINIEFLPSGMYLIQSNEYGTTRMVKN